MTRISISFDVDDNAGIQWPQIGVAVGAAFARLGSAPVAPGAHLEIDGAGFVGDLYTSDGRDERIGQAIVVHSEGPLAYPREIVAAHDGIVYARTPGNRDTRQLGPSDFDYLDDAPEFVIP